MTNNCLEVVVGTYEEMSLGYTVKDIQSEEPSFVITFTDHSHTASVKAVAVSCNGIAATGSSDETIKLFNMDKRIHLGTLLHHQGSVVGLSFFGDKHLFSYSEDGTIAIWNVDNWECLRTLHGHKSAVYTFAVHPSGKLAVSCSKDKTLRSWNLITGKCAYVTSMADVVDIVVWSPDGSKYIAVCGSHIDIYSFESATLVHDIHCEKRIASVAFLSISIMAVGCEKGIIIVYDLMCFKKLYVYDTGTNRVKAMVNLDTDRQNLVIVSSNGFIQLLHFQLQPEVKITKVAELNTGFRLLCGAARLIPSVVSSMVKKTIKTRHHVVKPQDADDKCHPTGQISCTKDVISSAKRRKL